MDPQFIAEIAAAIDPPRPKPSPSTQTAPTDAPPPADSPSSATPKRRGRPPKKPDDAYRAALAAVTGEESAAPKWTRSAPPAKRAYHRATFRKLPRKTDPEDTAAAEAADAPIDVEAAKAILKPRDGVRREWPIIPNGPKAPPPRVSREELQQIVNFYLERYGPILSLDEAAAIAKVAKQTLRQWVCQGCFPEAVFRGRPLRFLTHRFVPEVVR